MNGYRWRGHTARNRAYRRWADAAWEHDQRSAAQRGRKTRTATAPPQAPSRQDKTVTP